MNRQEAAETLGRNLREIRERRGLSRRRLGLLIDVAEDTIYKIENGKRLPRTYTLLRLCGALAVSPEELLTGIDWEPGESQEETGR